MRRIPTRETVEGPVCQCPQEEKEVNVYHSCFTCRWKYVYNKSEGSVLCDWRRR